jgi:hypothetical protein
MAFTSANTGSFSKFKKLENTISHYQSIHLYSRNAIRKVTSKSQKIQYGLLGFKTPAEASHKPVIALLAELVV